MLKDRLSPADEAAREEEMRAALAACPRILDLIARGALADPDAEAIVYLRSPLDPNPVVISNDHLMGAIKAAETFFRAQGIGKDDAVAILLPTCAGGDRRDLGRRGLRHRRAAQSAVHARGDRAQLNAVKAKLLLAPPPGMPGGLYEKIEGLQKDVPSLRRIVIAPLDGTIAFDGDVLTPDPAWRDDYGKCTDASEADRVAVMLPTGGTTGHPKVARLTNRAMVASCVSSRMALDYRKGDRAMIPLPLFHVGGLFVGVGACLSAGATIRHCRTGRRARSGIRHPVSGRSSRRIASPMPVACRRRSARSPTSRSAIATFRPCASRRPAPRSARRRSSGAISRDGAAPACSRSTA